MSQAVAVGWKSRYMNPFAWILHYVLPFLCTLTVLVFVHELGHYLVARWNKVRVEVFSIGFGSELFGWTDRAGTRWRISALPFGGYVKMFGEIEDPDAAPLSAAERAQSFLHKRVGQRAAIVVAGPLANFLFAVVVTSVLFATFGQPLTSTVVGDVAPGSAAANAGIKSGDKILALNGHAVGRFEDIAGVVQLGLGEPLKLTILRDGMTFDLSAKPKVIEQTDIFGNIHQIGRLGINSSGPGEIVHYGPLKATQVAVDETYQRAAGMLKAIGQIITGVRSAEEIGGVVRIAKMSGDVAGRGLLDLVDFATLLSINLGLLNLFPVPLLDGGRLLFYAFEVLRGRPLGRRAEEWGFRLGIALVFSLMLFATWNDLVSLKVVQLLKHIFA
jgi:regulator of sigma E protease